VYLGIFIEAMECGSALFTSEGGHVACGWRKLLPHHRGYCEHVANMPPHLPPSTLKGKANARATVSLSLPVSGEISGAYIGRDPSVSKSDPL